MLTGRLLAGCGLGWESVRLAQGCGARALAQLLVHSCQRRSGGRRAMCLRRYEPNAGRSADRMATPGRTNAVDMSGEGGVTRCRCIGRATRMHVGPGRSGAVSTRAVHPVRHPECQPVRLRHRNLLQQVVQRPYLQQSGSPTQPAAQAHK